MPTAVSGHAPVAGPAWTGITDTRYAPADPVDAVDAVGPSSYIQMVNTTIAIYNRTGTLIASASTGKLTGTAKAADLSDPQVMWDPATNRFYYAMINEATEGIDIGFSRSANPTSIPGSFCSYHMNFGFGKALPDYPKLGSTTHDLLIGANVFPDDPNASIHADVAWMSKPTGTGTIGTCPAQSSFKKGRRANLLDHSVAGQGWTPVPVQQTDPSTTGWVVGLPIFPDLESKGIIDLYKVSENSDGTVSVQKTATTLTVPLYADPTGNAAQQKGTSDTLDALDGRFTHAVYALLDHWPSSGRPKDSPLTAREQQVARLVADGYTTRRSPRASASPPVPSSTTSNTSGPSSTCVPGRRSPSGPRTSAHSERTPRCSVHCGQYDRALTLSSMRNRLTHLAG